jgi:hypothetical protein
MSAVMCAPGVEMFDAETQAAEPARIETTLFDLIAALQDETSGGDDAAVVASVIDLLETGRIRLSPPVGKPFAQMEAYRCNDCIDM